MNKPRRRDALKTIAAGALTAASASLLSSFTNKENLEHNYKADPSSPQDYRLKGNINHSVCQWTYNFLPLDELCAVVKKIGFSAIDLIPKDWPSFKKCIFVPCVI
jgi:hydroxypyruvate isomerase